MNFEGRELAVTVAVAVEVEAAVAVGQETAATAQVKLRLTTYAIQYQCRTHGADTTALCRLISNTFMSEAVAVIVVVAELVLAAVAAEAATTAASPTCWLDKVGKQVQGKPSFARHTRKPEYLATIFLFHRLNS